MIFGTVFRSHGVFVTSSTNVLTGVEFTAWKNMTIVAVRFYVYMQTGGYTTEARLYEDGTLVATSPPVYTSSTARWHEYSINYTLTAGRRYRLVVRSHYNYNFYVNFLTTAYTKYRRFQTNDVDSNLLGEDVVAVRSTDGGDTWTYLTDKLFSFLIVLSDNSVIGNPYTSLATYDVYGTNYIGEKIVITNTSKTINAVTVYGFRSGNPTDLVVEIKDADTNTVISSGSLSASAVPTLPSIISIPINEVTLEVGKTYYVYLKCKDNGGDGSNYYRIHYARIDSEYIHNTGVTDTNIRYASWGGA